MILRRIIQHVRAQDWTAIVLDFVIVVVGVFIGIQFSNLNDDRIARAAELEFVHTIRDDIAQGIIDSQGFVEMLSDVSRNGHLVLDSIATDLPCRSDCWPELLRYFFASQWIDVRTNQATFDEMKRTGLPRDPVLKSTLNRYYGLTEQVSIIISDLPKYRELVRSIIPASVQDYMWAQCFDLDGRQQKLVENCASPLTDNEGRAVVETLRNKAEVKSSLTYWLSTVAVVMKALQDQNKEGEMVIAAIDKHADID